MGTRITVGYPKNWRNTNYYLTLGVKPDASEEDLRKRHSRLKKQIINENFFLEEQEAELKLLDEAYETLADNKSRDKYNKFLARVHNFSNIVTKAKDTGIKYIFVSAILAIILPTIYGVYVATLASFSVYDSLLSGSTSNSIGEATSDALLSNPNFVLILQGLFWLGLLSGPILAAIFGKYKFMGREGMFHLGFKWRWVIWALVFALLAQIASLSIGFLIQQAYGNEAAEGNANLVAEAFAGLSPWILFAMVAIGAPIVEEIFYRGLMFTAITNRFGLLTGGIVSSLVFGLSHFQGGGANGIFVVLLTAALGGFLAYTRYKSGGLFLPILIHIGFNSISAVALIVAGDLGLA